MRVFLTQASIVAVLLGLSYRIGVVTTFWGWALATTVAYGSIVTIIVCSTKLKHMP